jgi:transcription initiation factor TFIIH subunit 2
MQSLCQHTQVLDLSHAVAINDMRPSRLSVMVGACRSFIRRFFELNPLGQLGLVVLRNGIAEKLTDLSGSPEAQIMQLQEYSMQTGGSRGAGGSGGGGVG